MFQVGILWNGKEEYVCRSQTAAWVVDTITEDIYYSSYYCVRIFFIHVMPCAILIILNVLLMGALRKAQKRRDVLLSKNTQKNQCKKLRDSNCTTMMLIVVVSIFLCVEVPFAVVTSMHVISQVWHIEGLLDYYVANVLVLFLNFFIVLSYPINFAVYCGMSRQFRQTFKELFIGGPVTTRNGEYSRYSLVNGSKTCTNETVL